MVGIMRPSGQVVAPPTFIRLAAHPLRWRLLSVLAESDYRVRDLVSRLDRPQNLVSYHLRRLRDGGLVTTTRSSFDGRDSYYHLDLDRCSVALTDGGAALHPALRRDPAQPLFAVEQRSRPVAVLFVCTGNSARSPIAEALLRHHTAGHVTVTSAGTRPRSHLHANAVRLLREEFGIDISGQQPRHLDALADRGFDHVITLCDKAREACPGFAHHHPSRAHWSIPDPATAGDTDHTSYPAFQRTAVEIDTRIRHLVAVLAATDNQGGSSRDRIRPVRQRPLPR